MNAVIEVGEAKEGAGIAGGDIEHRPRPVGDTQFADDIRVGADPPKKREALDLAIAARDAQLELACDFAVVAGRCCQP